MERRHPMKYMFLLYVPDRPSPEAGTEGYREMFEAYANATRAMAEAGVLIESAPLAPAATATTLRVRDGETLLTDGPAAEIKEQLGGYTFVDCASLDEALKWAATLPTAREGTIEVRPVAQVEAPA
jgi:hypothetical protein